MLFSDCHRNFQGEQVKLQSWYEESEEKECRLLSFNGNSVTCTGSLAGIPETLLCDPGPQPFSLFLIPFIFVCFTYAMFLLYLALCVWGGAGGEFLITCSREKAL
jgi:hypothetical protein